ncbi:lipid IV(A) 3-deoxy-D-manno-octulosonic acid transferase [Chitinilyticum piscinae]|uniref:3-deoxy-D-manno-octulosonic acid transferase n=1 Tax=Chitinilyticum piscinae TaxID=2866724 RepID=A0A8J7FIK6_9NEIS|nr:lipid IV(A) 3-deoxy-D-manno-octulosonic acid transferase [Chitinilyticum piscinae]MBE9608462.1 lipid IV(A) 3-deoxy-D-manno-octulosonic acid transferase [Chitinilyticum piscinae]
MMARLIYRLLLWCAFPLIWLYLLKRARKQPAYREHWAERLGFYPVAPQAKRYWIHAVSVGETRAAAPVIRALRERDPEAEILLTCMTPTGREAACEVLGGNGRVAYLPYDYPGAVLRFLRHWQPRFGLIMETEIWPNLIHACADRDIPLLLGNARLSERSARGYRRVSALVAPALARLAGVWAQDREDARRLAQIGAQNVQIMGSVKFDVTPQSEQQALGRQWREHCGVRPVLLLASSREGEESLLLQQWLPVWPQDLLLIIVPRHPQRFDEVAELLRAHGLRIQRRSEWDGLTVLSPAVQVLLGDSMGEMGAWYAAMGVHAEPVLMGGSLLPFGSQNLIEPCAQGVPVVLGPSTFNFAAVAEAACAAGAARQYGDATGAVQAALQLLDAADERQAMAAAGIVFTASHRGATARLLAGLPLAK